MALADGPDCEPIAVSAAEADAADAASGAGLCAHALMHKAATTAAARRLTLFLIFMFAW
ncbi:hypothetical protein GCM10011400_47580 [Paraburkholderia caffeinilytica]|uniref:Uncharacterized protein n=1 Tax=Paraburkholderia caffeinilytica TaxID=1761016 RepID=A0ABQ1N5Y8_9BURK|nr:hypothetical protein GCM10011400_47580 [Paraburkholderia caffeinilytica]